MASQGSPPIATNEVFALFPTLVCRAQLVAQSHGPLNRWINAWLHEQLAEEAPPAAGERLRMGHQLHVVEAIAPLAEFVTQTAEGMLRFMKAAHEGIEVTACWADIRGPKARLSEQTGVNAYLGAIYFCKLPEGSARVTFRDPRRQSTIISPGTTSGERHAAEVHVHEGTLLMFPAWLEHGMERNSSDEACVSLGFDLMFGNFIETMTRPLWQGNTYKRA